MADATGMWDRLNPAPRIGRLGDAAVGAAVGAGTATAGLISGLRTVGAQRDQRVAELNQRVAELNQRITALAERGALERARSRQRVTDAVQAAVLAVATSSLVDRIVDAQLERVLRPVVFTVLDDVLHLLEREPDRIQALIRGQRESMVDELVSRIRTGAAAGDIAVDRLALRVFHRERQPAPAPAPPTE